MYVSATEDLSARRRAARLRWLGATAIIASALAFVAVPAGGQTPAVAFVAVDGGDGDYGTIPPRWSGPNGASAASIALGGTISFSYPSGASMHNATFDGQQPVCTQTSPTAGAPGPRLPSAPSAPGWAGTCTFNANAVYYLVCGLHPEMRATITVGTPPSPPAPPPPPPGAPLEQPPNVVTRAIAKIARPS